MDKCVHIFVNLSTYFQLVDV